MAGDSNSWTSRSNRYKPVKKNVQNFFISMKSVHLMLIICLCYLHCKKLIFTALFLPFFCLVKIAHLGQGQFWPSVTCQILIKFSFLESLWHKETDCTSFARKKNANFLQTCQRKFAHFLFFLIKNQVN